MKYICTELNEVDRDYESYPIFRITRSFDINKPGSSISDLNGGVLGGSLVKGKLEVGEIIELRPGIVKKTSNGKLAYKPLITTITSIKSENNSLTTVIPGGLIGIGTDLDPFYSKNDSAVGNTIGHPGSLPDVYSEIEAEYKPIDNLFENTNTRVFTIKKNDMVLINSLCLSNKDLVNLLKTPIVKTDLKVKILNELFSNTISSLSLAFIILITNKKRENLLPEISTSFISLYKNKKNIQEVSVTTALPLDDSMRKELMSYVKAQNNSNIELIEKVDESLIGGAIITIGDKQLDTSISSKLHALRQKFSVNLYIQNY